MRRRAVIFGLAAALAATPAMSRGMYCTRHPSACRRRREYETEARMREAERREKLTPQQRADEDIQRAKEEAAREAKWKVEREQARSEFNWLMLKIFGAVGAAGLISIFGVAFATDWDKA